MLIRAGLIGPKVRPIGVADGLQVKIPVFVCIDQMRSQERKTLRGDGAGIFFCFQENPRKGVQINRTKTDTGGRVEYTKAIGRTILKELGKTAGCNFGRCPGAYRNGAPLQQKTLSDCLTKTQLPAKSKDDV